MAPLLEVREVGKRFGRHVVLQRISFTMNHGESIVLAGPNGSGKSTLLRIIAGLLLPDEGHVSLLAEENRDKHRQGQGQIGYVPERLPLLRFTPEEYLGHMGAIQGMDRARLQHRIGELLRFCRLEQARGTQIRHFSKGMLQKVGIMQALLSRPQLLLMDEPFSGLDVAAQEDLLSLLGELRQEGMALLFVSHEPELAEQLASRMLLLDPGGPYQDKLLQTGRIKPLMQVRAAGLTQDAVGELGRTDHVRMAVWESDESCFLVEEDGCDSLLLAVLQRQGSVKAVWQEQTIRKEWSGRSK